MALPIERRACTSTQLIPKATFLTMLGPDPARNGGVTTATRAYFEGLEDNQWSIISFNTATRDTCVQVTSPVGQRLMTITLPPLTAQKV
jgi:hypothetical protein